MRIVILLYILFCFNFGFSQENSKRLFYESNDTINLFAFIGKKVSVVEFDPNKAAEIVTFQIDSTSGDTITLTHKSLIMDNAFNAKYIILQPVFNNLKVDTVDFLVYDHYGRPGFEKYEVVLLYISKSKEGDYYVHQKYQFDEVQKSSNGVWKGKTGETVGELFERRKRDVFKERGFFK